jgi:endonuclease-3
MKKQSKSIASKLINNVKLSSLKITPKQKSKSLDNKSNISLTKNEKKTFSYLNNNIIAKFQDDKRWVIEQWKKIEIMRNLKEAPVDTMGVTMTGDKAESINTYRYQTLVSLVLSAQTKDETTFRIMGNLLKYGLNIDNIYKTSKEELIELIRGVNYGLKKAQYIKDLTYVIVNDFNKIPPSTLKDVMKLNGVGQKMGNLYMQTCFGENTGIAVDTHVHRIVNKLNWIENCKIPENSRKKLQTWLPVELWDSINTLLVGFGQNICKAIKPLCSECLLNKECEYGINYLKNPNFSKRSKKEIDSKNDIKKNTDISIKDIDLESYTLKDPVFKKTKGRKLKIEYDK